MSPSEFIMQPIKPAVWFVQQMSKVSHQWISDLGCKRAERQKNKWDRKSRKVIIEVVHAKIRKARGPSGPRAYEGSRDRAPVRTGTGESEAVSEFKSSKNKRFPFSLFSFRFSCSQLVLFIYFSNSNNFTGNQKCEEKKAIAAFGRGILLMLLSGPLV